MARNDTRRNTAAYTQMLLQRWITLRDFGWMVPPYVSFLIAWRLGFGETTVPLFIAATFISEVILLVAYGRVKELTGTNASGWLTARDMGWTVIAMGWLVVALLNDQWSLWTTTSTACLLIAVLVLFANFMLRGTNDYMSMEFRGHSHDHK